jgi:hypothetical protein
MKLIKYPVAKIESVEFCKMKSPSFFDAFLTDAEKISRRRVGPIETFAGRSKIVVNPVIEDDSHSLVLGEKIKTLIFDNITLYGVIPIIKIEAQYECVVDHYTLNEV